MSLLEKVIDYFNGAEIEGAAYKPTAPYTGKLPAGIVKKGSKGTDVKRVQNFLNWCLKAGLKVNGKCGNKTVKAIKKFQKQNGLKPGGTFGKKTKAKAEKIIKAHEAKPTPKPTPTPAPKPEPKPEPKPKEKTLLEKEMEACQAQSRWMKHATYSWPKWKPRNIAASKKAGTCVTYVACVLQRLGYLKSGQYIWHNGRGYGDGKVVGTNDKMNVKYMHNKSLKSLKDKLKAGDIIMVDDNKSGQRGSGGHIFILTGKWTKSGNPYVWDNETAKKGQKPRVYSGNRKVLARVRLKEEDKK